MEPNWEDIDAENWEAVNAAEIGDVIDECAMPPRYRTRAIGFRHKFPRLREPLKPKLIDSPEWRTWMQEKAMRLANREAVANRESQPYPDAPDAFVYRIFERVETGWKRVE